MRESESDADHDHDEKQTSRKKNTPHRQRERCATDNRTRRVQQTTALAEHNTHKPTNQDMSGPPPPYDEAGDAMPEKPLTVEQVAAVVGGLGQTQAWQTYAAMCTAEELDGV